MKKNFIYLLLLFSLIAQAQVTPSYPTIKLTKTVEGVKQDSLLVVGTDKTVKHIPASKLGTVKSVTGIDGVTVANGTTNPIIGISSISQLKVVGLVTDLSNKVDKVTNKSLSDENYTLVEKNKLAGLSNFDPTTINNSIANKVDKVAGKSLIADAEIARLSTVVNQDISGKEDSFSKNTAFNKNFGVLANTVSEGNHLHSFSDLQNNPTTIAGYGITDANKSPINVNVTTVRTTAAKIGTTISGTYTPSIGDRIDVTFTLGTAIANATLNIDGSGVKAIQLAGTNVTALSLSTPASLVVIPMYYNGTAWQIYGSTMSADTNTTYIEATTGLVVTTSTQVVAVNTLYYANNASNVAFTLPTTCAVNSIVHIVGMNSTGTYSVIAPSGDNIILEGNNSGAGGILNGSIGSTLVLRCTVANTTWSVVNYTGQIVSNTGYSTNKESTVNKSDSYTTASSITYVSTKALFDGLNTKANDADVIHLTGNEVKSGILTLSDGLKLPNNTTSATATKVNVQEADGVVNTIAKNDLIDVVEVNDVPSLPLTGVADKIYVVKNLNKIYRRNGTFYSELSAQNNIVRTLEIPNTSLSGVGRIEQQICDYILALPAEQRTIAETDSKWNVVITEPALYNIDLTSSNWEGLTTASAWESKFLSVGGNIANVSNFTLENGRVRFNVETDILELDLSNLYITDVGVIDIGGLQYLDLSNNQPTSFNPSIALPSELQYLDLSYNQLTSFNPSIALQSELQQLDLSNNQLTSFNPSIALPSGLRQLYLQSNQLTTISYTNAEAWANAQPAFTNPCNVYFGNNLNSITGTNLESILLTKNCIIIP